MEAPVVPRWRSTFGDRSRGVLRAAQIQHVGHPATRPSNPPHAGLTIIRHDPGEGMLSVSVVQRVSVLAF